MSDKAKVFVIPNTLSEGEVLDVLSPTVGSRIEHIRFFVVENAKISRKLLIGLGLKHILDDTILASVKPMFTNELREEIKEMLLSGKDVGIISDAGCPGIADPGQQTVQIAHELGCQVIPLTGPSSIFLALMASGFNGQNFTFHGYLPADQVKRKKKIRDLDRRVYAENQTQLFIETPYRNNHVLEDLLSECQKNTKICLAVNLTLSDEWIRVATVESWKKNKPDIYKKQCLFLIYK